MARIPLTHMTNNLPFSRWRRIRPCVRKQSTWRPTRTPVSARQFAYGVSAKLTEHFTPSSDLISITASGAPTPLVHGLAGCRAAVGQRRMGQHKPIQPGVTLGAFTHRAPQYVGGLVVHARGIPTVRLFLCRPSIRIRTQRRLSGHRSDHQRGRIGQVDWESRSCDFTVVAGTRMISSILTMTPCMARVASSSYSQTPSPTSARPEGKFTPKKCRCATADPD